MNTVTTASNENNKKHSSSMRFGVIVRIARKNLFFRKLRTILTIMGVVIGAGSVVFLVSFGTGLQKLVEKQVIGSKSIKTIDVTAVASKKVYLNDHAIKEISGMGGVENVGKVYILAGKIKIDNSESSSVVYAANQAYINLSSFNKVSGKLIETSKINEATVNTSFLKTQGITDNNEVLDKTISISFTVAATDDKAEYQATADVVVKGVIESGSGSEVFISSSIAENENIISADQLKVLASSRESVKKLRSDIESRGYSTTSPLDTISDIEKVFTLLQMILIGFGGIGMIIAVLGMFNTLTITLLERTKEIGLIVTLGGQQSDIKKLFITEALMLSMLGGIFGIITAFILGLIGDLVLNMYAHSNGITDNLSTFYISPMLVITCLIATALIGLVVVYFPARRAARISPLDAMRE